MDKHAATVSSDGPGGGAPLPDDLPFPMLLVRADGRIATANRAARTLLTLDEVHPAALSASFTCTSLDGRPLAPDQTAWSRAARGECFVSQEQWLDLRSQERLALRLESRAGAGGTFLLLAREPAPSPGVGPLGGSDILLALREAIADVRNERTEDALLQALVREARRLIRARYGALGVLGRGGEGLERFIHDGMSDEVVQRIGHLPRGHGLLGAVVRERRTIRVDDRTRDPRSTTLPTGHPPMTSFLGVPLVLEDEVIGNFYLADKEDRSPFTRDDERLAELFADLAALMVGRIRQTQRVDEQRLLFESVLLHAPDGILFFGAGGDDLVLSNAAAERLFGQPLPRTRAEDRAQLLGLAHPDGRPLVRDELPSQRALAGEEVRAELQIARPDGRIVAISCSAAPVRREGRILGAVVLVQDVTSFKEIDRLRSEFAAAIAHDLRNPIQVILLGVASLLRTATGGQVTVSEERLTSLQRTTVRLGQLASDLLDAARVDVRHIHLDRQPVDLPDLIESLAQRIGPTLGDHALEHRTVGQVPRIPADAQRLEQVLTNLLENAARYSPAGTPIGLCTSARDDGAEVSVEDHGAGIAPEDLPRLFDRFYQARRAREHKLGLGLGLYICKGLVEAHGGRIDVESEPGRGSTFRVWLPGFAP